VFFWRNSVIFSGPGRALHLAALHVVAVRSTLSCEVKMAWRKNDKQEDLGRGMVLWGQRGG